MRKIWNDQFPALKVSWMLKRANLRKNSLTNESHDRNEVLRIEYYRHPVFNEMWFLTVDPFMRVSVFIAKLSERQDCWRILEDFHSQEYIQFFDIHNCLFMRLHFSIGCYDCRRTARFHQGIHFSITQVLFADHVYRRSGVDNKFSFLKVQDLMAQASTKFQMVRRLLLSSFSFNYEDVFSLHAASVKTTPQKTRLRTVNNHKEFTYK